ncbi:MAG: hypothetical protein AAF483_06625 [Planctomycetota bacterium]
MRFSLGQVFGYLTLAVVAFGAAVFTFDFDPKSTLQSFIASVLATLLAAALFAIATPVLGVPKTLESNTERASEPNYVCSREIASLCLLIGLFMFGLGLLGAYIYVDNNLTMDTGGASMEEFIAGSGVIFAAAVGGYARGFCLVAFLFLFCGYPFGNRLKYHCCLCCASFVALLSWGFCPDLRGTVASIVSFSLLAIAGCIAFFLVPRHRIFAQRSRIFGSIGFLFGAIVGAGVSYLPIADQLLPLRGFTGCLLGAISFAGILGCIAVLAGMELRKPRDTDEAPTNSTGQEC